MKKFIALLLALCCIFVLCSCSLSYEYANRKTVDGVCYFFNKLNKTCFAASFTWDGDLNNTEITIRDEVDGYKVTELGGYIGRGLPTPFCIVSDIQDDSNVNCKDSQTQNVIFTVHLGKNLKEFTNIDGINDDIFVNRQNYSVFYKFQVSPDNKYFSTDDNGVLTFSKYSQEALEGIRQFSSITDSITE